MCLSKMKRSERIACIVRSLLDQPSTLLSLSEFSHRYGAAKSTISEDIALIREVFNREEGGHIETVTGAAGGVRYLPHWQRPAIRQLSERLCEIMQQQNRMLPGGFIYMNDIMFSPHWAQHLGEVFATQFRCRQPHCVLTVETKGIPLALMTARALSVPLVISRRDHRVTEGSSVSINYISGSSTRIQSMSLPRRALGSDWRVLIVDDFMRGGGSARGMGDLVSEFQAEVVGVAVLVETAEPAQKLVKDYVSLVVMEEASGGGIQVRSSDRMWAE